LQITIKADTHQVEEQFLYEKLTLNKKTNIKEELYGQRKPLLVLASFSSVWKFDIPIFS